jgi:hypothetical protein
MCMQETIGLYDMQVKKGQVEVVKLLKQYGAKHKSVNEAIKHLKPRSQEELEKSYENLKPDEKLLVGFENNIESLVKQAFAEERDLRKIAKLFLDNKLFSVTMDTVCDVNNGKIDFNEEYETTYFLDFLSQHNIKYKVLQANGPGGGWPLIEYTGKARDIIQLLIGPFDSGLEGYEEVDVLEMYLFGN